MTPRRRTLLLGFAGVLAAPGQSLGQASKAVPRVAIVFSGTSEAQAARLAAFVQGMREQGYADGRNFALDVRYADGKLDRLPEIVRELLERKPDVIVTAGSQAIWVAKKATSTVPIVMASVADPVGQGLIASLARPGGNVTGLAILTESLASKRLELLREVFPKTLRFGHLLNLKNPAIAIIRKQTETAATILGIELREFDAGNSAELDSALAAIATQRPHAVTVIEDALFFNYRRKIVDSLSQNRIPSIHGFRESAIEGGLMSYTVNFDENYRKSATYVHKILKGAKPGELPVEQPTHFELLVNLKTAKALGVKIPPSVLLRADKVIE